MKKKKKITSKDLSLEIKSLLEQHGFDAEKISMVIDYVSSLTIKEEQKSKPYVISTGANTIDKTNLSYVHTKSASEKFDNSMGRGS